MSFAPVTRSFLVAGLATLALAACQTTQSGSSMSGSNVSWTDGTETEVEATTLTPNPAPRFTAAIAPDGPTPIPLGAQMRFTVFSSEAGYGNVYLLSASGQSVVLAENLPLQAGRNALVPDPSTGIALTASLPTGTDRVVLLVTTQPMAGMVATGGNTVIQPQAVLLSHGAVLETINAKTAGLPPGNWALAEGAVTIVGGSV